MDELQQHKCPVVPNPVCKHGRPATLGQKVGCHGSIHVITGIMMLCPHCLMESFVNSMVLND